MNKQELFETMKAFSYEMFDAIEHEPETYENATIFDIVAGLLYESFESEIGGDILRKCVLEMTPDEFAINMSTVLTLNGKAIDRFIELSKE